MKKGILRSFRNTILLLGVVAAFGLASCENFLNGAEIKNQIEEQIAYANAQDCAFSLSQETEKGSFIPASSEARCKIGYSTELTFKINQKSYIFKTLEAVSVLDNTQSRSDCVEITLNEDDSDVSKGIYKINVKILKAASDILIRPVCIPYPAVVSYSPENAKEIQFANTPITINFNTPMDSENVLDNISITSAKAPSVNVCFESSLSSDGLTLTLFPVNPDFKKLITGNFMDVSVSLSDKICVTIDDETLYLAQNSNTDFTVRYKAEVEQTPPEKNAIFMTRTPISLENAEELSDEEKLAENFTPDGSYNLSASKKELNLRNTVGKTVYIYGKYFDEDSGVRTVSVKEVRTHDNYARSVTDEEIPASTFIAGREYENACFKTEDKITSFCIAYDIQSENGAVNLTVKVSDAATNSAEEEAFTMLKISQDSFQETYISNITVPNNFPYFFTDAESFNEEEYNSDRKKLYAGFWLSYGGESSDYTVKEKIYNYFSRDYNDITAYCQYSDKSGTLKKEKMTRIWDELNYCIDLDVESVNGLEGKIFFVDEVLNNSIEFNFAFPKEADVVYWQDSKLQARSYSGDDYCFVKNNEDKTKECLCTSSSVLDADGEYRILPYKNDSTQSKAYCKLSGDIGTKVYAVTSETLDYAVKLDGDIVITKDEKFGKTNITINLQNDTWEKFDSVTAEWYDPNPAHTCTEYFYFNKGSLSLNIEESTLNLYEYPYTLTLYGSKDSKLSQKIVKTIEKFTGSEHDNVLPRVSFYRTSYKNFTFKLYDEQSAPKSAYLITKSGEKVLVADETKGFESQIPVKTIKELTKSYIQNGRIYYNFEFEVEDTAGNKGMVVITCSISNFGTGVESITKNSTNSWKINSYRKYILVQRCSIGYYNISSWYDVVEADDNSYGKAYNINDGLFIRILSADKNLVATESYNSYSYYNYRYFYTGDKNTGNFDYMLTYSDTERLIASDAPVLVETVSTTRPYSECKDWSVSDWDVVDSSDSTISVVKSKILNLSASVPGPMRYEIPVSSVGANRCYVVIVHFADGTSLMSEVMQK